MRQFTRGSVARRRFLYLIGATGAAALVTQLPNPGSALAVDTKTAYVLDPEWGAGEPSCPIPHVGGGSCHACEACHLHAGNKFWTSAVLADQTRAHFRCKCLVQSIQIPNKFYRRLFGPQSGPLHRDEFDRRRDRPFPQ